MANELDELEALTQASTQAPQSTGAAPAPGNELDDLANLTHAETDAVDKAANDDKFDETDYYRQNGKTDEALDFAVKVRQAKEAKPAEPLKAAGSFVKGVGEELGKTGGDIWDGGKAVFTGKPHEAKSGLGSFVGGIGKAVGNLIDSQDDPAGISKGKVMSGDEWLTATKERIDRYDRLKELQAEERQNFLKAGGKVQDFKSQIGILPEEEVSSDERAAYDRHAAAALESSAAIHLGAQHGANFAIKGWRGLTEWNRKDWTPDQWKDRIRADAELRDTADTVKSGKLPDVERDGLTGMSRLSAMITPEVPDDVRQRLTKEGAYKPEDVEAMSGIADPTNLALGEALRLPIVSKVGGAALRLSGTAMSKVGSIADSIIGHVGAGRRIAQGSLAVGGAYATEHAIHGDYKPIGVALALFGARSLLRRGGALVDDAGRELLNPEGFNSASATRAAGALADDAAAGSAPRTATQGAVGNFFDGAQNSAAASRIARRTLQGAAIGVEGAVPFAALSDNPEQAGHAIGGGVAFGGALGPMGGIEPSLNRAMEINKAATSILAERGGAQTFADPGLQKAHDTAMADLPTGYQTYLNAMRGLVSGFRGRSGQPMNIAVLSGADFGREVAARSGAAPDAAATAHGYYDANSGTVFINKEGLRSRSDAAGHETGHFITDEVMGQMGRAYGDALRSAVEKGLFNGDKPTPEFQRFIDEYNKKTPGAPIPSDKGAADILRHRAVSEYLAETTRGILGEPNIGRFMLPKDVSDMMADKLVAMYGDEAGGGPKKDIFKRTDLPTIHAALKDVVFDLGRGLTPPASPTGRPRPGATAGAGTPQAVPTATGSAQAATGTQTGTGSPNPAMPHSPAVDPAEPHADIGVTQDTLDSVRDYHISPPGMEPRTQRANRRRGVDGKSADRIAEERGNEWDEMFSNYAEFLRTNGLQAPANPTALHQAVIEHALTSDPVARAHAEAIRHTPAPEPAPEGAAGALSEPEGASSIKSKSERGALADPEAAPEAEPAPTRETATAVTEHEITNRLTDAEKEAEADPSFAKKRDKGKAAAKRNARINALLDIASESSGGDQGLLQRRTDAGGQERFTGHLDPENIPAHRMLLDELGVNEDGKATIDLLNRHVGQTVYLDYKSAPKTAEGDITGQQRRKEYQESTADDRKAGGAHVEQKGKAFHITGFKVWPGKGSITLTGFSPDKWIANAHKLMEHVRAEGQDPGYTGVNDPHLATDMQGYAENHANGYKGDGSAPVEGREPTEGYTPWEIPKGRFNLLNAALNFDVSTRENSGRPGARENAIDAQVRAGENNVEIDPDSGDVNPLRAFINKSGKLVSTNTEGKTREGTAAHLENVYESISPDLVTGLSTTPDGQNIVRPVGFKGDPADVTRQGTPRPDYAASGFMPGEEASSIKSKGALSDEKETQAQYAARLKNDPASLVEEHRNAAGVPVLNGDAIIYNSPEFKSASKEEAPMVAKKLYPMAKEARDAALDHLVAQPIEGNGDALVMAGGIGSGKSTISKRLARPEFIYDTNLKSFEDATRNIDAILKSGRTVHLALVEREPGDAMRANLERFQKEGRIEYADDVGSSNAQARQNVRKLADHYKDNSNVTVEAWRNVRDTDPVKIPLSEVEDISVDAARKRAHDVLNEIEKGTDPKWKGEPLTGEAAAIARGTSKDSGRGLEASNNRAGGILSGEGKTTGEEVGGSPRGALAGADWKAIHPVKELEKVVQTPEFKKWSKGAPVILDASPVPTAMLDEPINLRFSKEAIQRNIKGYEDEIASLPRHYEKYVSMTKDPENPTHEEIGAAMDLGIVPMLGGMEPTLQRHKEGLAREQARLKEVEEKLEAATKEAARSKMKTGEPVIVRGFHATPRGEFHVFDDSLLGSTTGAKSAEEGHFFSGKKATSEAYHANEGEEIPFVGYAKLPSRIKADVLREVAESIGGREYAREKLRELKEEDADLYSQVEDALEWGHDSEEWSDLLKTLDEDGKSFAEEYRETKEGDREPTEDEIREYALKNQDEVAEVAEYITGKEFDTTPTKNFTHEVFLRMENPFVKDYEGEPYREESYYDVIKKAKAAGHDSVILKNTYDGGPLDNIFVLFKAEGNVKNPASKFDESNPDVRFMPREKDSSIKSKTDELGFFSGLSRLVDSPKLPNRGTGEQMLNTLKSQGAKPEELEWTGAADFLKNHDGPVTKAELKAFVEAGGIKLEEVQQTTAEEPGHVSVDTGDFKWEESPDGETIMGRHPEDDSRFEITRAKEDDWQYNPDLEPEEQQWLLKGDWGDAFEADSPWHAKRIAAEYMENQINERARERYEEHGEEGNTKYKDYTLPGGENYKESLLILPRDGNNNKKLADWKRQAASKYGPDWKQSDLTPYERQRLEALEADSGKAEENYTSSHWDEDNILAHIRQQDYARDTYTIEQAKDIGKRMAEGLGYKESSFGSGAPESAVRKGIITPEEAAQYSHYKGYTSGHDQGGASEKIRLIEELQSDWHQEGRKEGYRTPETPEQAKAKETRDVAARELREIAREAFPETNIGPMEIASILERNARMAKEEPMPYERWLAAASPDLVERFKAEGGSEWESGARRYYDNWLERTNKWNLGIPKDRIEEIAARARELTDQVRNAPDTSTPLAVPNAPFKKNWHELAFKRALRMAVEDGMDRIAWTPGEQQAERYDLSKQVGILSFDPKTNRLLAKSHGNATLIDKEVAPEKLADYVGKDVAKKLLETEPERGLHTLEGPSLKAGGEGMIGFYDKILPDFVRKYVKKWGGTVDKITIDTPKEGHMGSTLEMQSQTEVWSVKITPEMREAIMGEGQPMFMPGEEPSSIKSKGALAEPEVDALGFFSGLRKAAEDRLQGRSTPEQVLGVLDPTKGGVKREELEAVGLPQFLEGKKVVTKAEVLDFLKTNTTKLEEVVKGTGKATKEAGWTPEQFEQAIAEAERRRDWDEAERLTAVNEDLQLGSNANDTGNATKFSQYKTPGGENYQERLLKLPEPSYKPGELKYNREESASRSNGLFWIFDAPEGQQYQVPRSKFPSPTEALHYLNTEKGPSRVRFEGNHWGEEDVVAHTREQDFQDAEGSSVRLIEEIQSDWHQAGRKNGYIPRPVSEAEADWFYSNGEKYNNGELSEADNARRQDIAARLGSGHDPSRVANGPFKKSWHELAFKRALADAVAAGKDKIAWITGEQAAERFDLSKQVDSIEAEPRQMGGYYVKAIKDGAPVIEQTAKDDAALAELIGKEAAEKIIERTEDGDPVTLSGLDLKVGGQGMKGFYDKILPDFVKKYVKPWGGKVETTEIVTRAADHPAREFKSFDAWHRAKYGEDFGALTPDGDARIEEYRKAADEFQGKPDTRTVHSVTITPEMRRAVKAGQAMFMPGDGGAPKADAPAAPSRRGALAGTGDDEQESGKPAFGLLR